jgi:DNA-binding CsgD family transcriptional regulator/tetratricopeptide (TPR) repeat protein
LEAAEAVGAPGADPSLDVLDGLAALVDNSLLRQVTGPDGEARYAMLETVREYGLEQLERSGQDTEVGRRHAAYFLALAERAALGVRGVDQLRWVDRLTADLANVRAAFAWSLEVGAPDTALRLAGALSEYWARRGPLGEGRALLDRALAAVGATPSVARAWGLTERAWMALMQNDLAAATTSATEGAEVARVVGDTGVEGKALATLCWIGRDGDWERAAALGEEAVALLRPLGDELRLGFALATLGMAEHRRGNREGAVVAYEESLANHRAGGDRLWVAMVLIRLGDLACDRGDYDDALPRYREALGQSREMGDGWGVSDALIGFANVAAVCGQPARAGRLLGATEALCDEVGAAIPPPDRPIYGRVLAAVRRALGDDALAVERAAGRALGMEQAMTEAAEVELSPTVAGSGKTTDRMSVHGLSSRELDVLRLLAKHHTDKEIAEALFISPRTIQTHVERIRTKLGVENRREAAAEAVRLGLV